MQETDLLDFATDLIRQAESACAKTDPGMEQAAGLVYVGDVYALLVARAGGTGLCAETASREDVWPFIR